MVRQKNFENMAEAKRAYEERIHPKILLPYDDFLELVKVDCNTYSDIAKMCGVCRQAVSWTVKKYFAQFLPSHKQRGHVREILCARKHRYFIRQQLLKESKPITTAMEFIKAQTEAQGLKFQIYLSKNKICRQGIKLCYINNQLCKIHTTTRTFTTKTNVSEYFCFYVSKQEMQKCDFALCYAHLEKTGQTVCYVVPTADILDTWHTQAYRSIAFRTTGENAYHGNKQILDGNLYKNAWYRLNR